MQNNWFPNGQVKRDAKVLCFQIVSEVPGNDVKSLIPRGFRERGCKGIMFSICFLVYLETMQNYWFPNGSMERDAATVCFQGGSEVPDNNCVITGYTYFLCICTGGLCKFTVFTILQISKYQNIGCALSLLYRLEKGSQTGRV